AQRVVEDEDLAGARRLLHHAFHFRVVDAPHLVLVPEIPYRTLVVQDGKPLLVEGDIRLDRADIVNGNHVRLALRVRARYAGRRIERVVARPPGHRGQVIQHRVDTRQLLDTGGVHRFPPLSAAARRARTVWQARGIHQHWWRRNPPARARSGWPTPAARG